MIRELIKLANHLDSKGFTKEADIVDLVLSERDKSGRTEEDYNPSGAKDMGKRRQTKNPTGVFTDQAAPPLTESARSALQAYYASNEGNKATVLALALFNANPPIRTLAGIRGAFEHMESERGGSVMEIPQTFVNYIHGLQSEATEESA